MSFSINTNVTSLQAQTNLRASSDFQSKTIGRVTSGLRIVNSGDDAAGLAIANSFRSDQAVLTQGIRNANDGLSTLQTIDGGMNNISLLLDRARTLAAQSASGTFAGDRANLNSEFQSVMSEIDRQAQAVGMNSNGQYAKTLTTFIGGGKDATGVQTDAAAVTNGTVSVDLSRSAVDTKGLGLGTFQTAAPVDGSGNPTTTLKTIVTGTAGGGVVNFVFNGAGFSDAEKITIATSGTDGAKDLNGVAATINAAILAADATVGNNYAAFKAAGIVANVTSDGKSIVFASANSQFSVTEGGSGAVAARNILGTAAGQAVSAGGSQSSALGWGGDVGGLDAQQLVLSTTDSSGNQISTKVALATGDTKSAAIAKINIALQAAGGNLAKMVAVDEDGLDTTSGKIRIMGSQNFQTFVGTITGFLGATDTTGVNDNAAVPATNDMVYSASKGSAGAMDITSTAGAQQAVNALASAVSSLGAAQAAVGKGENTFNYAMNLAQSQSSNLAAAESRIRDADLASEAANLTKAQILIQAGTAALAQANSAPQAILSLLK